MIFIAVFLLIARDFVKPFSMDYIYSCFDQNEIDYVWGMIGLIPAIFATLISYLLEQIPDLQTRIPFMLIISILVAELCTIIAFLFLPKESKKHE